METPLPSTPPMPCYSTKSKLICSSAGLVVLVIVATASFLFGRALPRGPEGTLRGTPTAPISTPTSDETTNWKTYTENQEVGFSIQYPPNWTIKQTTGQIVELKGAEGTIMVEWGLHDVGGACPDVEEKIRISNGTLNMCHYPYNAPYPEEYFTFLKAKRSAGSLSAFLNSPTEDSRTMILQILSTFKFLE